MSRAATEPVVDLSRYGRIARWAAGIFAGAILATATAVWAASKYVASQGDIKAAESRSTQRSQANGGDIAAMKTEHQALREDVATTKADVGNLKEAAAWQMKVIFDLAQTRRLDPPAPPTMEETQ